MAFDYQAFIYEKIINIIRDNNLNVKFIVTDEQQYARKEIEPDTIYIVIKKLSGDLSDGVKIQPYQILFITEQNGVDLTVSIANEFSQKNNFAVSSGNGYYVKHNYGTPVNMSNFNEIGFGYRSIIYLSSTLYIMDGLLTLLDDGYIKVDGESIRPIGFTLNYSMTGDTQAFSNSELAKTVKSVSALSISFTTPLFNNNFIKKILDISDGNISGNTDFKIVFSFGEKDYDLDMKLTTAQVNDAPTQAPSIQLGFMV
jgi:hypothetical protein